MNKNVHSLVDIYILQKVCGQGLSCDKKRRPWSSFPMTQGLQNYYIVCFCSELSNRERIKEIAPKRINHFCWNTKWDEVKCHILKKAKSFILLTFLNISFFLNSARIFFFLALSFFLSFFQSSGRVLWQYENLICVCEVSLFLLLFPSLITVIGALEIHKLITVKSPEIKGNKRDLKESEIVGKNEEYPVHSEC